MGFVNKEIRVNLVSMQFQPNIEAYKEWLWYHHSLGFDKIYVLDNNDIGRNEKYEPLPAMYDNVTVIPVKKITQHQRARLDYAKEYTKDADYIIVLDADEFLYFKENQSVKQFLKRYEKYPFEQLGIPWKGMASNKAIECGGSFIDDFTKTNSSGIPNNLYNDKKEPNCIKSFLSVRALMENDYFDTMHILGGKLKNRGLYSANGNKKDTSFYDCYKYNGGEYDCSPAYICHYRWTYLDDIRKNSRRYKIARFYAEHTSNPRLQKDRVVDRIPANKLAEMYEARMKDYTIDFDGMKRRKIELQKHPFEPECMKMRIYVHGMFDVPGVVGDSGNVVDVPKPQYDDDWEDD